MNLNFTAANWRSKMMIFADTSIAYPIRFSAIWSVRLFSCVISFIQFLLLTLAFFVHSFKMSFQISAKRTNVPGMKVFRPPRPNPYMGFRPRSAYMPTYFYPPYGYGYACYCPVFILDHTSLHQPNLELSPLLSNWIVDWFCLLCCRKVPRFRMPMRYSPYYWNLTFSKDKYYLVNR